MCIFCVCTLLEVVSHYGSSVLSMSVMGFKKKLEWGGWGGALSISLWDFWNLFNFAKPLNDVQHTFASECQQVVG